MKILLIATGGTIAMHRGEHGYEPYRTAEALLEAVPEIREICDVDYLSLWDLDSADMTPDKWISIAEAIEAHYHDYDGFVVTHGTDTLSYTAAALSFFLQELNKPIVITGAQIPLDVIGSDGRTNLINAFRVATSDLAEVVVVFGTKVIRGVRARKISAFSLEAFESVNEHQLGEIGLTIRYFRERQRRAMGRFLLVQKNIDPKVAMFMVHPGMSPDVIRHAIETHHGVVLLGYGAGTIPTSEEGTLIPTLRYANERNVPVVLATQSLRGLAAPRMYRVGQDALDAGVIPLVDMTPETALVKLMWVLGMTKDPTMVRSLMLKSFVGEVTPELVDEVLFRS